MIVGDLNYHLDDPNCNDAKRFLGTLEGLGMKQCVHQPTHKAGHILDVVIVREVDNLIYDGVTVEKPNLWDNVKNSSAGDHYAIIFHIDDRKVLRDSTNIKYRKLRSIDINSFEQDILNHLQELNIEASCEELLAQYDDMFTCIIDKHTDIQHTTRYIDQLPLVQ